jgi:hypothetical protein
MKYFEEKYGHRDLGAEFSMEDLVLDVERYKDEEFEECLKVKEEHSLGDEALDALRSAFNRTTP